MENDHLTDPRRPSGDPIRDRIRDTRSRDETDGGFGFLWPAIAIGALILAAMLFLSSGPERSNTQIGQNVERPVQTAPNAAPKTTPQSR